MPFRRGIRANHATNENLPGGKERVSRTPERIARRRLRRNREDGLVGGIMEQGYT